MEALFMKLVEMSVSASWLVLAVLILRLLLKNAPRWIHVALWALVALRLVCPFTLESGISLIPDDLTEEIVEAVDSSYYGDSSIYSQGSEAYDAAVNAGIAPIEGDNGYLYVITQPGDPTRPVHTASLLWAKIWLFGVVAMSVYAAVSYHRLKKKVSVSIDLGNGVYICDYIDTPFILGIVKPKIYLPSTMEPGSASHVLAHERSHIARRDHWWKPLGYGLLTLHWFNPLLWLAYILLCRDIELACDEKVVRQMALPERKSYSDALLSCSVNRRVIAACPLAFGEVGVKERVKTVLNYKKPAFWIVLVAVVALIVTAVCFLTDPMEEESPFGKAYRVEKIIYRNSAISYYFTESDLPLFKLTEEQYIQRKIDSIDWEDLGAFSEIELSAVNFDELFFGQDLGMEEDMTLAQLREDNRGTWLLFGPEQDSANSVEFYLLLWQHSGDVYLAQGISFGNLYPLDEKVLDSTCSVNCLCRLVIYDPEKVNETEPTGESPYAWASTLREEDLHHCVASLGKGDWAADPLEGDKLRELVELLNQVPEEQYVSQKPEGEYDPRWNFEGVNVHLFLGMDRYILLRYAQDTIMIDADSDSPLWDERGNWVIENQALKDWLHNLSYGGGYMLSEANREEIRQLLKVDYVEYFSPQEFGNQLFIGCSWDGDRGLGIACFEKRDDGYNLLKLIRGADLKTCASGSRLYYGDYNDLRLFLVMNDSVTAMEWIGMSEKTIVVETPGLVVEYFPEGLLAEYRFRYNGGTTMYMDRDNNTVPEREDHIRDPRHFRELVDISLDAVTVGQTVDVDEYYRQNSCMVLDQANASHIWYLLSTIPDSAVEPATEVFSRDRYVNLSFRIDKTGDYQSIQLALDNGCVYYSLMPQGTGVVDEFWKIDYPELTAFIDDLYERDTSQWETFAPYPKSDGQISFEAHGVKVTVQKLACFEYELTEGGVRFKPEDAEQWVELQYHTEPFGVCGTGLETFDVVYGGHSGIKGVYDNNEYWSFMDLTATDGDVAYNIVLLNEDTWVDEYERAMLWLLNLLTFEVTE